MPARNRRQAPPPAADTEHNVDKALAAGQAGGTHKVEKPKPQVPTSKVKGDPERPKKDDNVNATPSMTYDQAMAALAKGELKRSVLTEQGWVVVPKAAPKGPGA